jgi:hypothetical protein
MDDMNTTMGLQAFRERLYSPFGRRSDALFELADAILTAGKVPSPAHLSRTPVHRRGSGSLYAAVRKGKVDEGTLRLRRQSHQGPIRTSRGRLTPGSP